MTLFGDTYIEPCVTGRVNKRFNGLRCHSQRTGVPFKPGLGSASFGERTGSIGEVGDSGSEGILEDVERAASYKSSASAMQRQLTGSTHALRVTHVERRYVIRVTVRTRVRSRRTRASRLEGIDPGTVPCQRSVSRWSSSAIGALAIVMVYCSSLAESGSYHHP